MERRNRTNQPKYYVLTYSDGRTPAKVVHGWSAVMFERRISLSKVSAKGFHTREVADRYRRQLIMGEVTFQNTKKPQIVIMHENAI